MSTYVDPLRGWGWKYGPSCHLIADSLDELHAFAAGIGMPRSWFQPRSFPHYDLTEKRRQWAVWRGARELHRAAFVAELRRIRSSMAGPST